MGEVIKVIDKIKIGGGEFDIELNKSASGGRYRDIHIQSDKFRLEIPENEFLQMASAVLLAKKNFGIIKNKEAR